MKNKDNGEKIKRRNILERIETRVPTTKCFKYKRERERKIRRSNLRDKSKCAKQINEWVLWVLRWRNNGERERRKVKKNNEQKFKFDDRRERETSEDEKEISSKNERLSNDSLKNYFLLKLFSFVNGWDPWKVVSDALKDLCKRKKN